MVQVPAGQAGAGGAEAADAWGAIGRRTKPPPERQTSGDAPATFATAAGLAIRRTIETAGATEAAPAITSDDLAGILAGIDAEASGARSAAHHAISADYTGRMASAHRTAARHELAGILLGLKQQMRLAIAGATARVAADYQARRKAAVRARAREWAGVGGPAHHACAETYEDGDSQHQLKVAHENVIVVDRNLVRRLFS